MTPFHPRIIELSHRVNWNEKPYAIRDANGWRKQLACVPRPERKEIVIQLAAFVRQLFERLSREAATSLESDFDELMRLAAACIEDLRSVTDTGTKRAGHVQPGDVSPAG